MNIPFINEVSTMAKRKVKKSRKGKRPPGPARAVRRAKPAGTEQVFIVRADKPSKVLGGKKNKTVQTRAEAERLAKRAGARFQVWNRPV